MIDDSPRSGEVPLGSAPLRHAADPLERCVAMPLAEFAANYWSRAPLYRAAASTVRSEFSDLFGTSAVDELISRRGLRAPFARMAKQGSVIDSTRFTRSGGVGATIADQLADDKVLGELADGASLVLQGLHRTWPPLIEFGSSLASQLGHPVQINAYVTPPQNQGFSAHYDTHDVFVLQIAGRKRWLIHSPVLDDPLPEQGWESQRARVAARAAEPPLLDLTMEPGDSLYLPRGFLHSATALGELSIHLTVGVHPVSRYDLVREALACAAADPELRRSLPIGIDLSDPAVLGPLLAKAVHALSGAVSGPEASADEVAERIGASLRRRTRPAPISPLQQLKALDELSPATRVQLRAGLRLQVSVAPARDGETLRIDLLDRFITMPAIFAPAVELLRAGHAVMTSDLPGLDPDEQLVLVRRLLREAAVVVAPGAGE